MTKVFESALKVALVCIMVVLVSCVQAEEIDGASHLSSQSDLSSPIDKSFGSFSSGPYRGPPRYESSPPPLPPPPHRFRSFYSGPYHGPPLYEIPPPPHHFE
ncbi:hypothetical protein RJT34_13929 [Clitoria ternatea]|uniref:Uncharacterized protein n=1 Tax=Clitoria ternatea TaxID=43366 RepID=A0AAN9JPG4_CLITE